MTIYWKRNSCLDGLRVTVDAYVGGERVAQIASTVSGSGKRVWDVWYPGGLPARAVGIHRTLAKAKAEVLAVVSPQVPRKA
jgi:hypothetical protein